MKDWIGPLGRYAETVARETGRLLATLATTEGARRRVDWLLDTMFLGMVDELEARGVPRRVAADMLGMSHRTLQRRYSAAAANAQLRGRSVWVTVVDLLREGPCSRELLLARCGPVPPVVIASVLHDMLQSGWIAQEDDRLTLIVQPGGEITPELLADYIDVRRRVAPSCTAPEVAAELGVELARVEAAWARSDALLRRVDGDSRWLVMQRCVEAITELLQGTADDPNAPRHSATWWRVRLDDKPAALQAQLRDHLRVMNRGLKELLAHDATQADDEEGARFWTFVAFQTVDASASAADAVR